MALLCRTHVNDMCAAAAANELCWRMQARLKVFAHATACRTKPYAPGWLGCSTRIGCRPHATEGHSSKNTLLKRNSRLRLLPAGGQAYNGCRLLLLWRCFCDIPTFLMQCIPQSAVPDVHNCSLADV
jgi:hypothetical protein